REESECYHRPPACCGWRRPAAVRRFLRQAALQNRIACAGLFSRCEAMLVARDLWKSYGEKAAVTGISLEARAGEIVGLLGPNGAGKSTTVAMLCGLTPPDRGTVTIGGEAVGGDDSAVKRRIGLVTQEVSLFEDLPAAANLELFGALYGVTGDLLEGRV